MSQKTDALVSKKIPILILNFKNYLEIAGEKGIEAWQERSKRYQSHLAEEYNL